MKAVALVSGRALVMLFGINVNLNLVRPASTPSGNCRTCSVIALKLKQNIRFQVARMPDHLTHIHIITIIDQYFEGVFKLGDGRHAERPQGALLVVELDYLI